jgi:hypothetical protein
VPAVIVDVSNEGCGEGFISLLMKIYLKIVKKNMCYWIFIVVQLCDLILSRATISDFNFVQFSFLSAHINKINNE